MGYLDTVSHHPTPMQALLVLGDLEPQKQIVQSHEPVTRLSRWLLKVNVSGEEKKKGIVPVERTKVMEEMLSLCMWRPFTLSVVEFNLNLERDKQNIRRYLNCKMNKETDQVEKLTGQGSRAVAAADVAGGRSGYFFYIFE